MSTAKQTFYTLICGTLLIFVAAIFTVTELHLLSNRLDQVKRQVQQVKHLVQLARAIPTDKMQPLMILANRHLANINIGDQPIKGAKLISYTSPEETQRLLTSKFLGNKISVQITPYHWLNINEQPQINQILLTIAGFYLIGLILLASLIILCFWAVKRLTMPLTELSKAVKRFGADVNTTPMAKTSNNELNEVVEAFNQMQARIRKFFHDRTQMLAAISHDLRTPITRLKLRAEYFFDSPQYKEMLEDFDEMENMITSVLLFAREDAYNEPMDRFDLEALLDSLCEDMINAGLKVKYRGLGKSLPFFGRINTLKRAFTNIINNAVKYGKQADVKLHYHDDSIHIEISDKGPGIPEDALEKVFEPFYRVEKSRSPQTGGTGLGLAIAKDAIFAHGGDITLRNLAKGGLQAIITLPLRND